MVRICVWGDSITAGHSDDEGGWCDRLKRFLIKNYDDDSVYNLGISGDNTEDLVRRFETEVKAREPDIIVFSIGVNDSQFDINSKDTRVPIGQFSTNLKKLHHLAKIYTEKILFVGITPVDDSKLNPIPWDENKRKCYSDAQVRLYDDALKNFCKDNHTTYINVRDVVSIDDMDDGLHPNTKGHEKMFKAVSKQVVMYL